jgi:uncharacterized BrkB/YihY/UPF0761 family membrane protein
MFTIYVIGVVVLGLFASYRFGQANESHQQEVFGPFIAIVLGWPLFLIAFVVLLPFFVMYFIGVRNKKKKEK